MTFFRLVKYLLIAIVLGFVLLVFAFYVVTILKMAPLI